MSLDDLQAQLRGALDQQFAGLKQHYEQAIIETRRQATAEAQQEAAARLEAARAEWQSGVAAILEAAPGETRQQGETRGRGPRRAEPPQQVEPRPRDQLRAREHELQQQLEQPVQHSVNSLPRPSELE